MKILFLTAVAAAGLTIATATPGLGQQYGEFVSQNGPAARNVYLAGRSVSVDTDAAEDIVAAGSDVTVRGRVAGDVIAAGRDVLVDAAVASDVRAAGRDVTVRGSVAGDITAAGAEVRLERGLIVGDRIMIAGGTVEIDAEIGGDARIAGADIALGGTFLGSVDVAGQNIVVRPGARIAGDFTYRSVNEADIDPAAQIAGDITFIRSEATEEMFGGAFAGVGAGTLMFLIGLVVLGAVHLMLFPEAARHVTRDMRDRPGRVLATGAAVFVGTPILAVILAITVIGLPVTIFLVALFLAALFAAYLSAALLMGQVLARLVRRDAEGRFWPRVAALAVGLLVLSILALVPLLGPLIVIAALMLGLGSLVLQVLNVRRRTA